MRNRTIARWAGMLALAFLLVPISACDEILDVNNPAEINDEDLLDEQLLDAQVAGVLKLLEELMSGDEESFTQGSTFLTDEQLTGLNWEDWQRVNQRIVIYTEGPLDDMWDNQSEFLMNGRMALEKLDALLEDPSTDRRVALVSMMVGYGYVFMAETWCQVVLAESVDQLGTTLYTHDEILALAFPHFERAIDVGTEAGDMDIVYAAHVGLARAYLTLGNWTEVTSYAGAVPTDWTGYWVEYSAVDPGLNNNLYNELRGSNHTVGVHPAFLQGIYGDQGLIDTQTDPRIQHTSNYSTGHDASTLLYKPYMGLRFEGYTGATIAPQSAECPNCTPGGAIEGTDVLLVDQGTNVLLADGLEAQHHYYEAIARQNPSDANLQAFVNARRAVGNELAYTGADWFAELRRQRSRDLYMGGIRLGDLRRWKRDGVGDFFPTGPHPNPDRPPAVYGVWTCYVMPLEEYEGNPGLERPADPLSPPPGII
ncbi:MAG: hypothetical protein JSV86_18370 [Gemmatimonadota bacterium]|nr:MAG: hypothetical protein JSV86_18370 [Gemmatimonadota bacterium]